MNNSFSGDAEQTAHPLSSLLPFSHVLIKVLVSVAQAVGGVVSAVVS